jgi:hypothetical protein
MQAAVTGSEGLRQVDLALAQLRAGEHMDTEAELAARVRMADLGHYRRCVQAPISLGLSPEPFMNALRELGATLHGD